MDPGVCATRPETPSLPLPPTPTGQLTDVATPTFSLNVGDTLARKSMKMKVVPEPSDRWTTVMSVAGSFAAGLSFTSAGSFHFWILPR